MKFLAAVPQRSLVASRPVPGGQSNFSLACDSVLRRLTQMSHPSEVGADSAVRAHRRRQRSLSKRDAKLFQVVMERRGISPATPAPQLPSDSAPSTRSQATEASSCDTPALSGSRPSFEGKRPATADESVDEIMRQFSKLESPTKATPEEGCAADTASSSSGQPSSSSVRRMELDEDDEVNEGHADKVQKVGSRSGMDQCSADESVHAIQRQFAMLRSPQKGEARSSSSCPPGGVLADEARPSSQNLLQLMGPDQNTQSGAASPYITASAPRQIGFGTPRPSSQLANSGLGRESSSLVSLRTSGPGLLTLGNTFKQLTGERFKVIKSQQRSSNGLWKSSFAFPGQERAQGVGRNVFDRDCLIRANEFVCLNIHTCEKGDCLHQVETVDISSARQRLAMIVEEASHSSTNAGKTREVIMREHLTFPSRPFPTAGTKTTSSWLRV